MGLLFIFVNREHTQMPNTPQNDNQEISGAFFSGFETVKAILESPNDSNFNINY